MDMETLLSTGRKPPKATQVADVFTQISHIQGSDPFTEADIRLLTALLESTIYEHNRLYG